MASLRFADVFRVMSEAFIDNEISETYRPENILKEQEQFRNETVDFMLQDLQCKHASTPKKDDWLFNGDDDGDDDEI